MNKAVVFGRRNIIETLRSPVSWIFGLLLPIGIFIIMQIVVKSIGEAASNVPMFGVNRFTGGVVIFGASFLSLFCALIISGDRAQSFLARLFASPMKPTEYIVGYVLGALPIAAVQIVIIYVVGLCFGLTPSWNILPTALFSIVIALLFIFLGVILGSVLSAKGAPPICSVVVQVAALLSGMWFDLDMIGGGFNIFCHILPFANAYDIVRYTLAGDYGNVWLPFIITFAYAALFFVISAVAFGKRAKRI